MGLPVEINPLFVSSTAGYTVGRSLRFRSSASAYLNRTPASNGNSQKFTWSGWVKRGTLSVLGDLFSAGTGDNNRTLAFFQSDNTLIFGNNNSGLYYGTVTTAVFRDPSAWYHIVFSIDTTQATTANRVRIYINNVEQTATSAWNSGYIPQNTTTYINTTSPQVIGANPTYGVRDYYDGYLAEVNLIDGQQLTPSSFGAYDNNGVWQPIKYTGTYGTNGFYLPFSNTTSTTTLVQDSSGNGNNWTPNNISLTAGTTYDSMIDSPTVSASSSNYAVLNPLTIRGATGTLTNGNLSAAASSSSSPADTSMYATLALPSNGLIYLEALYTVTAGIGNETRIGVSTVGDTGAYVQAGSTTGYWSYDYKAGTANAQGTNTSYTAATTGQTVMWAIDVANGKIWAGANGTWFNSGNPAAGTGAVVTGVSTSATNLQTTLSGWVNRCSLDFNFGQRPFTYTPPSGYSALNTYNLPTPTIKNGAQYMAATLWTGTGSSQAIANSQSNGGNNALGSTFQPDFVWGKIRSGADYHVLSNSIVGADKFLKSNTTDAETTNAQTITSFNSNGFSVGTSTDLNRNTYTFVGWQWKAGGTGVTNTSGSITSTVSANTTAGFSVVTYSGNSSTATVGHGLGVAPSMYIVKSRTYASGGWSVYHTSIGATGAVQLNSTSGTITSANWWNNTAPTSSVFSLAGVSAEVNTTGNTYVAYCFAAVKGYSAFGSYSANGSTDGPFIYTGFRPRFILSKRTDSSTGGNWQIEDTSRATYNVVGPFLRADNFDAEGSGTLLDILSNGFKLRTTDTGWNAAGGTYIYAAFAENPFNYSRAR